MSSPTLSRRQMLFGGWLRREPPRPAPVPVRLLEQAEPAAPRRFGRGRALPVLRPPGALPEERFLTVCTRCDACAAACPHDAIVPAPPRLRGLAGTPIIEPARAPCWLCQDRPCAAACEPRALELDRPPAMGQARIQTHRCLAHLGTTCTTCVERCPVPGALRLAGGSPRVDPDRCAGCGVCLHLCPAPQNALIILPRPRSEVAT